MFTKEIAITLPLMILLYEFSFFKPQKELNWKSFFLFYYFVHYSLNHVIDQIRNVPRDSGCRQSEGISPMHYLLTQFRVMVTYIRLVFLPFNQNIDYDYPISKSIFEFPAFISLIFLTGVLFYAKHLFAKYRLVSFSIFWFFLTLLPESSFLPLKDVIFEHRLYLPLAGYSIFLVSGVYYIFENNHFKTMSRS